MLSCMYMCVDVCMYVFTTRTYQVLDTLYAGLEGGLSAGPLLGMPVLKAKVFDVTCCVDAC